MQDNLLDDIAEEMEEKKVNKALFWEIMGMLLGSTAIDAILGALLNAEGIAFFIIIQIPLILVYSARNVPKAI